MTAGRASSLLLGLTLLATACTDDGQDPDDMATSDDTSTSTSTGQPLPDLPLEDVTWAEVSAVFAERECAGCHGSTPQTYASVVGDWIEGPEGNLLQGRMEILHRIDAADAAIVLAWLADGYPES